MSAYVVYEAVITDADQYERYKELAAPSVAAAGGRYLVRGGAVETFEGATPARVVRPRATRGCSSSTACPEAGAAAAPAERRGAPFVLGTTSWHWACETR